MVDLAGWLCIVAACHVGLTAARRRGIGVSNPIWAELAGMAAGLAVAGIFVWSSM